MGPGRFSVWCLGKVYNKSCFSSFSLHILPFRPLRSRSELYKKFMTATSGLVIAKCNYADISFSCFFRYCFLLRSRLGKASFLYYVFFLDLRSASH